MKSGCIENVEEQGIILKENQTNKQTPIKSKQNTYFLFNFLFNKEIDTGLFTLLYCSPYPCW